MRLLNGFNHVLARILAVVLTGVLLISGYALFSNFRTYRDAEDVYNDLLKLKPDAEDEDLSSAFDTLRAINPDIRAWLTVEGTKIDYPVLQGKDNVYYMNRDVYLDTSLAGSIFLDSRNSGNFTDPYTIIYGHHMDRGLMFGDLDLFLDKDFFDEPRKVTITTENGDLEYRILAVMSVNDSTREIFDPDSSSLGLDARYGVIAEKSVFTSASVMEEFLGNLDSSAVVALVTCTNGPTGNRLVLFIYRHMEGIVPDNPDEPPAERDPDHEIIPKTDDSVFNSPA
ncbi:MAG: class B sortase, partial [Clostridia bacterium]|nr:class B sortase [Clostridia bacterium]